ncbi:MAG: sulfotransferase [Ignavibacteriales bacterium]|nr:sulfotransferase [Ignavibacteriales bacterium]
MSEKKVEPFLHYIWHGWKEGRRPNQYFSPKSYLKKHPEIADIWGEPLSHSIRNGWKDIFAEIENSNILLDSMRPPVFIFGPPRSGSTYLVRVLNQHENFFITNELRVMSFINDLFHIFMESERMEWNLKSEYRNEFINFFKNKQVNTIKSFYLEKTQNINMIWGDKNPHYADPKNDPGALETIRELFPDAKYIHIYRHPRNVINSLVEKGWTGFKGGVVVYKRIITTGREFGKTLDKKNYFEIKYEDLCSKGLTIAEQICNFLDVQVSNRQNQFLMEQEQSRTPICSPVTPLQLIGKEREIRFSKDEERYYQNHIVPILDDFGYRDI